MAEITGISANLNAFLDTISFTEGTQIAGSDDGYNVVVGGGLFKGYAAPQHFFIHLGKLGVTSSAIGRYQILYANAVYYIGTLKLPDFGPVSQDKIAIQLIKECGALGLIEQGNIRQAVTNCNSRWASFPGNTYGQRQVAMDKIIAFYKAAGGTTL